MIIQKMTLLTFISNQIEYQKGALLDLGGEAKCKFFYHISYILFALYTRDKYSENTNIVNISYLNCTLSYVYDIVSCLFHVLIINKPIKRTICGFIFQFREWV